MSTRKVIDMFGDAHQIRSAAPSDDVHNEDVNEAPPECLQSSKEKFARLNPYFETVLTQLASSDKYTLPDDIYNKLAEALSIRNRGDVYSSDLLLTIGKLQPYIARKTGVKWSTIEKDIIRPKIRQFGAAHYPEALRTLDTIPKNEWFYGDEPLSSAMDILLAARRMNCEITYDEWSDVCRMNYKGETLQSMKLDDIYYLLTKELTYHFKFRIEKRHTMDALGVLRRNPLYVFNSRIDWLNSFVTHYDPSFDWQRECVEILQCKVDDYHKEVARALFISSIERSYRPGCILQHMIILDDPLGNIGKSTFCRILAGNPTLDHGHTKYFTDKNIFAIKNDVTRYAETKAKAVHEYAELARLSQMNLEHLKNDISSAVESYRPLWSQDLYERPRWFYSIGTTNKDQYNYDVVNRRYFGMKVAPEGKMIDNQRFITNYSKIMGSLVWSVKNGMSGAISKDVAEEARYQQDIRIAENDLMRILKQIIAFCHCYEGTVPGNVKALQILERYQIGYRTPRTVIRKLLIVTIWLV
jgi:hypothetical protein